MTAIQSVYDDNNNCIIKTRLCGRVVLDAY